MLMVRVAPLAVLAILLCPLVAAAADPQAAREEELGQIFIRESQETRDYITAFGEDTNRQFEIQKEKALDDIQAELRKLKFTLAITLFCSVFVAMELHSLLQRRRERRVKAFEAEEAGRLR